MVIYYMLIVGEWMRNGSNGYRLANGYILSCVDMV